MPSITRLAVSAVAVASSARAAFDPASKNNVVTYWGQGSNQARLLSVCQNPNVDIINVGFVNVFPDQGPGGWPGTNFGNACYGDTYTNNGAKTDLLKTCPDIPGDVIACQQTYGKKIFLSLGGAYPNNEYISNKNTTKSAQFFANFLWSAFGPVSASQPNVPRPWGNASVDGFDFDIESMINPAPFHGYQSNGYAEMINYLKYTLYPQDPSKAYYISGAPQCPLPDVHLTSAIANAWFDFVWIQFYNNPSCSARAGIQHMNGAGGSNDINFDAWCGSTVKNPNIKMFIGVPASDAAAPGGKPSYYLNPTELYNISARFYNAKKKWGGIMVWEATYAANNTICGRNYLAWTKAVLNQLAVGKPLGTNPTTCKTSGVNNNKKVRAHAREFAEWLGF